MEEKPFDSAEVGRLFSLSPENAKQVWPQCVRQTRKWKVRPSMPCQKRSETGRRRQVRLAKQCQNVCEAERRRHQKGRLDNKRRLGLVHKQIHLRSTTWRWTNRDVKWQLKPGGGNTAVIDGARLLPEFDAVYVWTPRDGVIIVRMITFGQEEAERLR